MTGSEAALQAQALCNSAAELLREIAQSSDLALCDTLTRKALQQIEAVYHLLDGAEAPPPQLAKELH